MGHPGACLNAHPRCVRPDRNLFDCLCIYIFPVVWIFCIQHGHCCCVDSELVPALLEMRLYAHHTRCQYISKPRVLHLRQDANALTHAARQPPRAVSLVCIGAFTITCIHACCSGVAWPATCSFSFKSLPRTRHGRCSPSRRPSRPATDARCLRLSARKHVFMYVHVYL